MAARSNSGELGTWNVGRFFSGDGLWNCIVPSAFTLIPYILDMVLLDAQIILALDI